MVDIAYRNATQEDILYIWDNLREHDTIELQAAGFTRDTIVSGMSDCNETLCGFIDDEPVAIFGHVTTLKTIRFNFFSTDKCSTVWKSTTKSARSYINWNIQKYPKLRPIIEVWENHNNSRRWLKLLGFKDTKAYRHTKYGKMIFVEYYKYKQNKGQKMNIQYKQQGVV